MAVLWIGICGGWSADLPEQEADVALVVTKTL